jgi:acetylornithine deacetylase
MIEKITAEAIQLLKDLIQTPSFSTEEDKTALLIEAWMQKNNIAYNRQNNNVWARNKNFDSNKPNLLLNSHHDTVQPNKAYTKNPFEAIEEDGKIYGLGSNDAGGCLVSLLATFTNFYDHKNLNYNLVFVASAEEESSGNNGLNSMLKTIPKIDVAIVGEPTLMNLAIAEKGLVVFDVVVKGTPGHAAHPNENNPIYNTIPVLQRFKDFKFNQTSRTLGEVKLTVTQIQAGVQHNAIPSQVDMVLDVRVNDCYTNTEIVNILHCNFPELSITPRTTRLNSSCISPEHPLVIAGKNLGRQTYGSPTLSDQSCLNCQSVKMGPGDTNRSHSADEFIYVNEIKEGIKIYIDLLKKAIII